MKNPSLTDTLCTRCGLCCDGTLFADVELANRREATALEVLGMDIDEDDGDRGMLMLLPCRALKGTRCSIYSHRPETCRTFECGLLQGVRRGTVDVEEAKTCIAAAQALRSRVARLSSGIGPSDPRLPLKERYEEALTAADDLAADSKRRQKVAALEEAMTALRALIRKSFLPD